MLMYAEAGWLHKTVATLLILKVTRESSYCRHSHMMFLHTLHCLSFVASSCPTKTDQVSDCSALGTRLSQLRLLYQFVKHYDLAISTCPWDSTFCR